MKYPVAIYTIIAAVAAGALGGTLYMRQLSRVETQVAASTVAPERPVEAITPVAPAPQPQAKPKVEGQNSEVAIQMQAPVASEQPAAGDRPGVAERPAPSEKLPAFDTVRVEKSGEAVIAGRAEADAEVTVKWNGAVVGKTRAGPDGAFVLMPDKPLSNGIGAMVVEMSKNGAVTTSEGSVVVAVNNDAPAIVAKVDPLAPTVVVPAEPARDVQLTAVDYDAKGNIVFSGQAAPGTIVRFYVDNVPAGEGVSDTRGLWSFKGSSAISPGTHTLRADAVDANGKVLSRIELPFLREEAVNVAQAQPTPETTGVTRASVVAKEETNAPKAELTVVEAPAATETQVATITPLAPAPEAPRKLVIQPGNNLWRLSREVYGKGRLYTVIFKANRNQLKNPNRIYPGQILTAPKLP